MSGARRSVLLWCSFLVLVLGIANFTSFLCVWEIVGGNPHEVREGRYFLWKPDAPLPGGRITEVSRFTYLWVLWQRRAIFLTLPFEFLAAYFLLREQDRRRKERSDASRANDLGVHRE